MLSLGIDTSLSHCSVAIVRDGQEIASESRLCPNKQAEEIAPLVQEILANNDIKPNELDKVIVTNGPGSFTGVRVGLAFAKSLAFSINKPCIGVSTLQVFAMQSGVIKSLPLINVAGSVFYMALDGREIIIPPTRADDFSFLETMDDSFVLCGPAAQKAIEEYKNFQISPSDAINPFILASFGALQDANEYPATPIYLRGADAKLWKGARLA